MEQPEQKEQMDQTEQKQQLSFEQSMQRLEQIVRQLEKGDVPLEDAMRFFEEGTGLARRCQELLDRAEQQVVRLSKGPDGEPVESEFPHGDA